MIGQITVYDAKSGQILRTLTLPVVADATGQRMIDPEALALNVSDGEAWIAGRYSSRDFAIIDGQPVDILPAPDAAQRDREEAIASIRAERNRRLAASDWTQMPDAPLSEDQRDAWRAYRQALRDMLADCDPDDPVWPEIPT